MQAAEKYSMVGSDRLLLGHPANVKRSERDMLTKFSRRSNFRPILGINIFHSSTGSSEPMLEMTSSSLTSFFGTVCPILTSQLAHLNALLSLL